MVEATAPATGAAVGEALQAVAAGGASAAALEMWGQLDMYAHDVSLSDEARERARTALSALFYKPPAPAPAPAAAASADSPTAFAEAAELFFAEAAAEAAEEAAAAAAAKAVDAETAAAKAAGEKAAAAAAKAAEEEAASAEAAAKAFYKPLEPDPAAEPGPERTFVMEQEPEPESRGQALSPGQTLVHAAAELSAVGATAATAFSAELSAAATVGWAVGELLEARRIFIDTLCP